MTLFKYLHSDRTDVLRSQSIRFSSPTVLNDPFELNPHLAALASPKYLSDEFTRLVPQLVQEELSKLPVERRNLISPAALNALINDSRPNMFRGLKSNSEILVPMLQHAMARKLGELIGILCLSEYADNLLMWAHYADSHRGFVVEFNTDSPFFDRRINPNDELRSLRKVAYSSNRPSLTLADMMIFRLL